MSTQTEITRLQTARNKIRTWLVGLGLAASTDKLDALADKAAAIKNQGAVDANVKEGESYTIPAGYHNGSGTVKGVSGGGNYNLQTKSVTPTKEQQSVAPDQGYYGLSAVTVGAIPENFQDVSAATAQPGDVRQGMIYFGKSGKATGTKIESQIAVFADITDAEQITAAMSGLNITNWSLARICKAQDGCLAVGLVILPFAYPAATEDYTGTKTKRESGIDYIILTLRYAVARTVDVDGAQCKYSTSAGKRLSSVSLDASVPHTMQLKSGGAAVASFLILPYLSGEQS